MAWISNESHVDVDWQGFFSPLLWPNANGNCLLTDTFSRIKIMLLKRPFHWFWTALLNSTYPYFSSFCLPYSQPCTSDIAALLVPLFSNAPSCSEWTRPLLFEPGGERPGDAKPFPSSQDIPMMPQIYEDIVLRAVLTLTWWQNTPGTPCNGLHDTSTDPRNISHYPRGKQDAGVRTLILIRSVSLPHLFCSRPEVWVSKARDLQWSSTVCFLTSNDKQHHLLSPSSALPLSRLLSLLSLWTGP